MLAKLTSKNQLTLPKQALDAVGPTSHFQIELDQGRLILTPARLGAAEAVRRKLAELDLTDADIIDAVSLARRTV